MQSDEPNQINEARRKLTGYSPEGQAIIELINHLMQRYEVSLYDLEAFDEHECERD